ncbi:hypothetical protein GDO86_018153 [Hymenochirus boettgeri]|uniref:Lipoxygenase domain-containing protein n=1 Tax=Hymenochirus boettgeri TaxID=247094 RepID=A0A8T2IGR0_9PIPI|nr:hypothetical protein GDO86_018153 [Hymenochirus boettgeri]
MPLVPPPSIGRLIIPHLRYTLEINTLARSELVGPGGSFDQAVVTGNGGIQEILLRGMNDMTYTSLCLPDDIESRGVQSIPNYFYKEDGMKIWKAMESYISNIVHYYYLTDETVSKDPELQVWVAEIFDKGFLSNKSSGIPSTIGNRVELTKYLTMIMFTCSAQHAAVNSGQFDFYSWLPNGPTTMRKPPPASKGSVTYQNIMEALPAVNTTAIAIAAVDLLSTEPSDRTTGKLHKCLFCRGDARKFVEEFRGKLVEISKSIKERNQDKKLKYNYLDPDLIESSVSI